MNGRRKSGSTRISRASAAAVTLPIGWSKATQFNVPIPRDEKERLAALKRYRVLDTEPEEVFDDITLLASHTCQTPIAMLVMLDSSRQWFKARLGTDLKETPREIAFCAHTIMQRDLLLVPDAAADKRFATNPLVTSHPGIRFYAGVPLVTPDNRAIGTLCVIDRVPRKLTSDQENDLAALGRLAMSQLELRRRNLLHRRRAGKERPSARRR